jgi:hypothetical protein
MAAGFGTGQIAKMVAALVTGGGLEKAVMDKLVNMGGEFLLQQISFGPLSLGGAANILMPKTLNLSDLLPKPLAISDLMPRELRVDSNFLSGLRKEFLGKKQRGNWRAKTAWGRSNWATSRNDWLDNHWRHDWRSQPRDVAGKWVPGRLPYIATQLQMKGKTTGRRTLRRRRLRRQARLRGRKAAKRMFRNK